MDPLLTVIIPTYKNYPTFVRCFMSLIKYTEFPLKVVAVNNDPDPGSRQILDDAVAATDFEHFKVLHMDSNKGWMGGINAGMELVDTPLVCMMNDDLVFIPGCKEFWRVMARHIGPHSEIAAVGPASNYVSGRQSIFDVTTPSVLPVPYLIGFCMMLRTETFREVGLLDETLPGGDDFDLSIRLRQAGYTLLAEKNAYVHHIGSLTGRAVHGAKWDSAQHQDDSNNAIMRKHGLRAWYETMDAQPFSRATASPELRAALGEEDQWWEEKVPKDQKGLNIGCGDSRIEGVPGLDLSKRGERSAGGRKFTGADPDVTGDAADLPVQDSSLDFLAAKHIFEHMLDPVEALAEWKRALKPGGMLLASCPNQDGDNTMLMDYTHVHAYSPSSLSNLLESQGFEVEGTETFAVGSFGVIARNNGAMEGIY